MAKKKADDGRVGVVDVRAENERMATLLKMVADPTRLGIIRMLGGREYFVGELCDSVGQSQPAVSHHIAIMRHAGVIRQRREGKNNFYSLTDSGALLAGVLASIG